MANVARNIVRGQVETIANKISSGYTDSDIMRDLGLKRHTYYNYKRRVIQEFGAAARKKSEDVIEFEAEVLKDRYIRLYRNLELRISNPSEKLYDVTLGSEIAAVIATNILRLETEGLRARQGRGLVRIEDRAQRYLGAIPIEQQIQDTTTAPIAESGSNDSSNNNSGEHRISSEDVF